MTTREREVLEDNAGDLSFRVKEDGETIYGVIFNPGDNYARGDSGAKLASQEMTAARGSAVRLAADADEFDAGRRTYLGRRLHGKIVTALLVGTSPAAVEECARKGLCNVYVDSAGSSFYVVDEVMTAIAVSETA